MVLCTLARMSFPVSALALFVLLVWVCFDPWLLALCAAAAHGCYHCCHHCCCQALEGGAASSDDEDIDERSDGIPRQPVDHSYAAEQQQLKKAFLQAAEQALDEQEGEDAAAKGLIKKQKLAAAAADGDGDAAGGAGKEQQVNEVR
jgi:hypothetical protein